MRILVRVSDNRIIGSQSKAPPEALIDNAVANGYTANQVAEEDITMAEFKSRRATQDAADRAASPHSRTLASNATHGFLLIPKCAGTPKGVPVLTTEQTPIVYDTQGKKLWVYDEGWQAI